MDLYKQKKKRECLNKGDKFGILRCFSYPNGCNCQIFKFLTKSTEAVQFITVVIMNRLRPLR